MSLNPFTAIEKLINEHGSATILRERLALAADQFVTLEKENINLQESLSHAITKIQSLESHNANLEKQIANLTPSEEPGHKCPYCRKLTGKLERLEPHREHLLKVMGVKIGHYHCENPDCGKDYDEQINPKK